MQTASLIVITIVGGLLVPFAVAGYTSYTEKTIPDIKILFRFFLAGIVVFGASAFAWLFGAGGDPGKVLESVGEALEVKDVLHTLSASVTTNSSESPVEADEEIQVGVAPF
jgi:hypothetical protein